MELGVLTYRQLEEITDGFSEERLLGAGSFGKVYKGTLENGDEIAVKVLSYSGLDDERFREYANHMRLNHPNIVRVVGYCNETEPCLVSHNGQTILAEKPRRALCLEYMHNGSLQNHLSDECDGLDWPARYKIIKGISEGLKYLHVGYNIPIYHLDLKPGNILLDRNMVPKLADFGLSPFGREDTRSIRSPIGTIGYLPPEYIWSGEISERTDIFSLGVVMIEIIAGRSGFSKCYKMPRQEFLDQEFLDLVQGNWRNRLQRTWSSSWLEAYCQQVKICTEIGLNCLEGGPAKRPTTLEIVSRLDELESGIEGLKEKAKSPLDKELASDEKTGQ